MRPYRAAAIALFLTIPATASASLTDLVERASSAKDPVSAGHAILQITQLRGPHAKRALRKIHEDTSLPMLNRTWAAAARVQLARDFDELMSLMPLRGQFPALQRPIKLKVEALIAREGDRIPVGRLLSMATGPFAGHVQPLLLKANPKMLTKAMLTGRDNNVRWQAARYVATVGAREPVKVTDALLRELAFDGRAMKVPWQGGALYIPRLNYDRSAARSIVAQLTRWRRWAQERGMRDEVHKIDNNLRSVGLMRMAQ